MHPIMVCTYNVKGIIESIKTLDQLLMEIEEVNPKWVNKHCTVVE